MAGFSGKVHIKTNRRNTFLYTGGMFNRKVSIPSIKYNIKLPAFYTRQGVLKGQKNSII